MAIPAEAYPAIYALIGALTGSITTGIITLIVHKRSMEKDFKKFELERKNQREILLFEKLKNDEIQIYRHLHSSLLLMFWQIDNVRSINKVYENMKNSVEKGTKYSTQEVLEMISKLPPDIQLILFEKIKVGISNVELSELVRQVYNIEFLKVQKIQKETVEYASLFSLFADQEVIDLAADIEDKVFNHEIIHYSDKDFNAWVSTTRNLFKNLKKKIKEKIRKTDA